MAVVNPEGGRHRRRTVADAIAAATSDDRIARLVTADAVRTALAGLRPEYRRVLIELYYRRRSVQETAELLGISEVAVKSRAIHALRALLAAIDRAKDQR